jgi:hypothetical protein
MNDDLLHEDPYRDQYGLEDEFDETDAEIERAEREARELYDKLTMEAEALEREIAMEENRYAHFYSLCPWFTIFVFVVCFSFPSVIASCCSLRREFYPNDSQYQYNTGQPLQTYQNDVDYSQQPGYGQNANLYSSRGNTGYQQANTPSMSRPLSLFWSHL